MLTIPSFISRWRCLNGIAILPAAVMATTLAFTPATSQALPDDDSSVGTIDTSNNPIYLQPGQVLEARCGAGTTILFSSVWSDGQAAAAECITKNYSAPGPTTTSGGVPVLNIEVSQRVDIRCSAGGMERRYIDDVSAKFVCPDDGTAGTGGDTGGSTGSDTTGDTGGSGTDGGMSGGGDTGGSTGGDAGGSTGGSSGGSAGSTPLPSGDLAEVGIDLNMMAQIKADAANGVYDRPCTTEEHDPHKWHMLVDPVKKCHYNHHHGDDPNYVNDIFGEPGAWFGKPGQSISYPWQTFSTPMDAPRDITAVQAGAVNGGMENQAKHEGYFWLVRRNQPCEMQFSNGNDFCVKDLRLQFHGMFFGHGAAVRYHSFSAEMNLCVRMDDPSSCGIYRTGGWMDHGFLKVQYPGMDEFNRVMCTEGIASFDRRIAVPADNHFGPLPTTSVDSNLPFDHDTFRCHPNLSADRINNGPSNRLSTGGARSEWWTHGATDFRYRVIVNDPIGAVTETSPGSGQLQHNFYCAEATDASGNGLGYAADPNCRWNQSLMSPRLQYVISLNGYWWNDFTSNGVINVSPGDLYINRFGGRVSGCTGPSLDCIPVEMSNVRRNPEQLGYFHRSNHHICNGCELVDHDVTPTDRPSWIRWFYRMSGSNNTIPNPGAAPGDDGCSAGLTASCATSGSSGSVGSHIHGSHGGDTSGGDMTVMNPPAPTPPVASDPVIEQPTNDGSSAGSSLITVNRTLVRREKIGVLCAESGRQMAVAASTDTTASLVCQQNATVRPARPYGNLPVNLELLDGQMMNITCEGKKLVINLPDRQQNQNRVKLACR